MIKIWFIQHIDGFLDVLDEYADIHISDYNLAKVRKLKLSKLRWCELNGKIGCGFGTGKLKIGKYSFKIDYAWGGRHDPKNFQHRTSYTVRLRGKDIKRKFKEIRDQIVKDECGSLKYFETFRECYKKIGVNSVSDYRIYEYKDWDATKKSLKKYAPNLLKFYHKKAIEQRIKEFEEKWNNPDSVVILEHSMKNIETDKL